VSDVARLNEFGQSPWYDNITRTLVREGGLAAMVRDDGIRGVTSNPTIFEKAISSGEGYDDAIAAATRVGDSVEDTFWDLAVADVGGAADVLAPVHEETEGRDGFVSIEVSPLLAHDTDATIAQAAALHDRLARPNIMIKIPATPEGLPAITSTIGAGINVNVTLIFDLERYEEVIDAYLAGLEILRNAGGDLGRVHSVASFFVSRMDTEADKRLPEGSDLRGKVAVANAKLAYERFVRRQSEPAWESLASAGANLQRPLWASTSTKNPAYSPTLYVDTLIGPNTVNTLAPPSIEALRAGEANLAADTVSAEVGASHLVMADLEAAGVSYSDVTATLEREGVASFAKSYEDLLDTLGRRARAVS
jgi:transaldolase